MAMLLLMSEVERLRSIYSSNRSFDNYSTRLLEAANLILTWRDTTALGTIALEIENSQETEHMSQLVTLALKMKGASPLSFEWAMVGYFYAAGWQQRIAAARVRPMFLTLMRKRFEKKWPQGLKLRQRKSQFSYHFQSQCRTSPFFDRRGCWFHLTNDLSPSRKALKLRTGLSLENAD